MATVNNNKIDIFFNLKNSIYATFRIIKIIILIIKFYNNQNVPCSSKNKQILPLKGT